MADRGTHIEELVVRAKAGERRAYEELFNEIRVDVHRILLRSVGPDPELDDMLQTAFLEIFRSLKRFKGDARFSTWLYRVVVNVAFQHIRKRKNIPAPVDMDEMRELVNPEDDPLRRSEQNEEIAMVREILAEMAPKKRVVFLLHEVDGFTPDEIAERLDMSRFTIKSRLFYARKEFQKKLRQKAVTLAAKASQGGTEGDV